MLGGPLASVAVAVSPRTSRTLAAGRGIYIAQSTSPQWILAALHTTAAQNVTHPKEEAPILRRSAEAQPLVART